MNRLLIVSNEVDTVIYLARIFEIKGLKVSLVKTGQEGIDAYEKDKFDFVLLDLFTNRMKAWQIMEALKKKDAGVRVFIHTTGSEHEELRKAIPLGPKAFIRKPLYGDKKCIEAGMDDYISKPVKMQELVKAVEKACLPAGREANSG